MKGWGAIIGAVLVLVISGGIIYMAKKNGGTLPIAPSPSPKAVVQLSADKQPRISLQFSLDAHFVTVSLSNLNADQLEYNLIYDATVKTTQIQTGVNSTADIEGKSTFTQKQLLGSESSGKFTYHTNIKNAVMELTLRDSGGHSVFTQTYPFTVSPGKSIDLVPSE